MVTNAHHLIKQASNSLSFVLFSVWLVYLPRFPLLKTRINDIRSISCIIIQGFVSNSEWKILFSPVLNKLSVAYSSIYTESPVRCKRKLQSLIHKLKMHIGLKKVHMRSHKSVFWKVSRISILHIYTYAKHLIDIYVQMTEMSNLLSTEQLMY